MRDRERAKDSKREREREGEMKREKRSRVHVHAPARTQELTRHARTHPPTHPPTIHANDVADCPPVTPGENPRVLRANDGCNRCLSSETHSPHTIGAPRHRVCAMALGTQTRKTRALNPQPKIQNPKP